MSIKSLRVKPLLSVNKKEARERVLILYKQWYREIPYLVARYDIPKSREECLEKLRELFYEQKKVTDIRIIDLLVFKGHVALKEVINCWCQKHHLMSNYFKETHEPKPKDFMTKFVCGID